MGRSGTRFEKWRKMPATVELQSGGLRGRGEVWNNKLGPALLVRLERGERGGNSLRREQLAWGELLCDGLGGRLYHGDLRRDPQSVC